MINLKGEISFWLVKLILALVGLLIAVLIISQIGSGQMEFLDWLRDIL